MNNLSIDRPTAIRYLVLLGALTLGACASTPPPVEKMAVAEAAVQRASSASTSESAPAELGVAVAKMASARSALAAGDPLRAGRLADEATLAARFADMRAQSVRSISAARESEEAARVLREELSRKTLR